MSSKIINILHNNNKLSIETVKYLKKQLLQAGFTIPPNFHQDAELVISIGGDGSFLWALHKHNFPNIPIIGINTGHLGFFSEINPKKIDMFIEKYISGDYFLEELNTMQATICTRNNCISTNAINEIVIKGDKSRTVHLSISVNDTLIQKFSGDGILVATSTGSTAYNYSVGGSIVDPSLNVLQVTPLAPINTNAYRSFTSSVIFPSNTIVKVEPEYRFEDSIVVVSDGSEYRFAGITEVTLQYSPLTVKMLRLKDFNFWSRVINKFL